MFETRPRDNSSLLVKLLLRQSLLELGAVEPSGALDLFAGTGEIASRLYLNFQELHLVEQDEKKFKRLEQKFLNRPNTRLYNADNREFIQQRLRSIKRLSVVDFDAYGSPNRQIQLFFDSWRLKSPLLVFATDGFSLARLRGLGFAPALYLAGPDAKSAGGRDPVLNRNFELLVRSFWNELAKLYNFRIALFKLLWKKRKQVAYYGLLIEPRN